MTNRQTDRTLSSLLCERATERTRLENGWTRTEEETNETMQEGHRTFQLTLERWFNSEGELMELNRQWYLMGS